MNTTRTPIEKIIQLETVCITLEEAQALNNTVNAAHAWVYNPHKHTPEFELLPVNSITRDLLDASEQYSEHQQFIGVKVIKGQWTLYNADVFVAVEQIEKLISDKVFYFAPLNK